MVNSTKGRNHPVSYRKTLPHMNSRALQIGGIALLCLATVSSFGADPAANADVKGLIDSAKLTFDYVLPIGLAIMGTFLAVTLGTKAWKRFAK